MNSFSLRHRSVTLLATLLFTAAPALRATDYVNWGGPNYVSGNGQDLAGVVGTVMVQNDVTGDFDGDGFADDVRDFIPFTTTDSFNPTVGYGGLSNVFYGGVQVVRFNATSVAPVLNLKVLNNTAGDRIRIGLNTDNAGAFDLVSGFLLWDKDDFPGTGTIGLDSESGLALSRVALTNCRFRLLIRNGATVYVSNTSWTGGTGVAALSRTVLANETWSVFSDPSSLRFTGTTFSAVTFNDITGVGLYFESWRGSPGANVLPSGQNFNLTFDEFVFGAP